MKKTMHLTRLCFIKPLTVLFSLWTFSGCKKEIVLPVNIKNVAVENMLQLPTDANTTLLAITNNLRTQLRQQDFSSEFIRLHGQPLWDKAIKKGKKGEDYVLFVPTQLAGVNNLASFFTACYREGQFSYQLYPRAAMVTGLHGRPAWWVEHWLARLEAKTLGKKGIRLQGLSPTALAKARQASGHAKGHFFGVINPAVKQGAATEATDMASNGFVIIGNGDDCCIEIWENPDGDTDNNNGDEYYLHDDCSDCPDEEGEVEDELVDGVGSGCPWYNPMCNYSGGGGNGWGLAGMVDFLTTTLQLGVAQTDWLLQHGARAVELFNYLYNGHTAEALVIAKDHINEMMANAAYLEFVMLHQSTGNANIMWYEDQLWVNQYVNSDIDAKAAGQQPKDMTLEEFILTMSYPIAAATINFNANKAIAEASLRYPSDHNVGSRQDAFRHTYWLSLNASSNVVGTYLALQFANAHEANVRPEHVLEKDMDVYNNIVGVAISVSFVNASHAELANASFNAVSNGACRYLKPLDYSDPCFSSCPNHPYGTHGITSQTQLVPTNQ